MKHLTIGHFEEKDIDFAYQMTLTEKWNMTRADIKRMFDFEPSGCFIAETKGVRIGHVFTVCYGKLGWTGLLIVKSHYRRKGVATILVRKAIDYLTQCGVETIKLEAVPEIADLYRRLGFIDEFDSLRFAGRIGTKAPHPTDSISPMQKEEIGEIAKFDAKYFGAYRTRILTKLYQENPKFCFVSHENSGLAGYVMYRRAEVGYSLGPFVCDPKNPKASRALLARCIHELGSQTSVHVGVPAVNRRAVEILRDCGFKQFSKSIRMSLGKSVENEEVEGIFAIGGAMKG